MTRRSKLLAATIAGLALSGVAAGVITAIVKRGREGPGALSREDRAKLSELIRRLKMIESISVTAEAVALRSLLQRIERDTGSTMLGLRSLLGRLQTSRDDMSEFTLAHIEELVDRIESAASQKGL